LAEVNCQQHNHRANASRYNEVADENVSVYALNVCDMFGVASAVTFHLNPIGFSVFHVVHLDNTIPQNLKKSTPKIKKNKKNLSLLLLTNFVGGLPPG